MTNPLPSAAWYLKYHHNESWAFIDNLFTAQECEQIKKIGTSLVAQPAQVGAALPGAGGIDLELRKNTLAWIDSSNAQTAWIYQRLTDAVNTVNKQFWEYKLDYIEALQYTIYQEPNDHYHGHIDMMLSGLHLRKLSFSLQLSDPDSYRGCDLEMNSGGETWAETKRTQGTFIAFPSWLMHRVTPLTEGTRHSLVGWVCGPKFQ